MKLLLISVVIFSAITLPIAFAESDPYILVQIIHKDSNGNLLAYLQSDKMTNINLDALNFLLDKETSHNQDPIYQIDGKQIQVIYRQFTETIADEELAANAKLLVNMNNVELNAVSFIHDGFRVIPGDTITTVWSFVRSV